MTKGSRIKELRLSKNMTQPELARLIGTTKQTIYKYENGAITNIPSDKVEAIADVFNVSPSYILGWPDGIDSASDSQIKEAPLPEGLSDVKQLLIEEILSADDADIADLISYLKVKKGITLSDP